MNDGVCEMGWGVEMTRDVAAAIGFTLGLAHLDDLVAARLRVARADLDYRAALSDSETARWEPTKAEIGDEDHTDELSRLREETCRLDGE